MRCTWGSGDLKLRAQVEIRGAVAASLAARGLEAVSKFALYAITAHVLGGEDSGLFFLCLSLVHIPATLARLGLERPLTRHVAAELAVGRADAALRAAVAGSLAVLAASLLVAGLLALGSGPIADLLLHQADIRHAILLAALTVPVQNLAFSLAHVLIGLERSVAAQMVMNALAPTLCLIPLALGVRTAEQLLLAYVAAFAVSSVLGLVLAVRGPWRTGEAHPAAREALPSLWSSARPLLVVEVGQAALLSVPVLVLGAFADPVAVSVFAIASRLSMLVATVVISLGAMAAPQFARHYRLGEWAAMRAVDRRNRRLCALVCVPLILVLAIGAAPVLTLLGIEGGAGAPVLLILLCGQLVFCLLPSNDVMLAMTGQETAMRRLSLLQLPLCVALCFALIPPLGAIGAAMASALVWTTGAVGLFLTVRRLIPQLRDQDGGGRVL